MCCVCRQSERMVADQQRELVKRNETADYGPMEGMNSPSDPLSGLIDGSLVN